MGLLSSVFLSMFYLSLVGFSFISYSVGYCLFLLAGVLCFVGFIFLSCGVSWYVVLFSLVYVGGVFVLLLYVSLYNPSFYACLNYSYYYLSGLLFCLLFVLLGVVGLNTVVFSDCGHYLCSLESGFSYCFFCVVLLVGFGVVSLVSSSKDGFVR